MRSSDEHALRSWAASGAMVLSGRADGAPVVGPGNSAGFVEAALTRVSEAGGSRTGGEPPLPTVALLGERAATAGLGRRGPQSCGGAFRTFSCLDGWLGLSLPREDDHELVPALVGSATVVAGQSWDLVRQWAAGTSAGEAAAWAGELGLASAQWPSREPMRSPVVVSSGGRRDALHERPLVIDLTSLWAGPLAGHLLGLSGCRVVKVESRRRPDGARRGPADFFDLLHHGHDSVAVDLDDADDRDRLLDLLTRADLVLESSRARAMQHHGIRAQELVAHGTSWVSITARGRDSMRIGFGDDVAVEAGLAVVDGGDLLPVGDALADPLTGVMVAAVAAELLLTDRAQLADVSMIHVARQAAEGDATPHQVVRGGDDGWWVVLPSGQRVPVAEPAARAPRGRARPLGADTNRWLR